MPSPTEHGHEPIPPFAASSGELAHHGQHVKARRQRLLGDAVLLERSCRVIERRWRDRIGPFTARATIRKLARLADRLRDEAEQ